MRLRALVLLAARASVSLAILTASACGSRAAAPKAAVDAPRGPALIYAFEAIDGRPISSEAFANRITVIGFFTTYDVHSQVAARFLASLAKRHTPRINAAALMLEAAENKPLVDAFVVSMGLPYPVAMADAATIAGEGPFAGLHHVPSIVILDPQGREAFRRVGLVDEAGLEAAVRAVEQSAR
jgi:hypothetical protein